MTMKTTNIIHAIALLTFLLACSSCHHEPVTPVIQPYDPLTNTFNMKSVYHMRGTSVTGNNHNGDTSMYNISYDDTIKVISKDSILLIIANSWYPLHITSVDTLTNVLIFEYNFQASSYYLTEKITFYYNNNSIKEEFSSGNAGSWGYGTAFSY